VKRFAVLLPLLLSGCYFLRQGAGQLDLLWNSRPIGDVLADPAVPAEQKAKLELIRAVKAYGIREMALAPSGSYERYYDTGGKPVTWVVTACRKDRFEPYTWWFPIVGTVPYKGYFAKADAEAEAKSLEALDLDVYVSPTAAYSTLGWFNDPVLSTMLGYGDEDLANLILHELTHGTLWLPGGVDFNEGLASFVGGQGALEYFRKRDGTDSTSYARAVRAQAREEQRDDRAIELFKALDAVYRSGQPREEILRLREEAAVKLRASWMAADDRERRAAEERRRLEEAQDARALGRPAPAASPPDPPRAPSREVNNAAILMQRRYGRYDQFRKVFEEAAGEWDRFFERMASGEARRP
jgi:predicted aminopeptidase